jgi:hypothetical protein
MKSIGMVTCVGLVLAATACMENLSATEQPIIAYGSSPLQLTWIKASHNTYENGHTPSGQSVAWHFNNTTNHIELDLRDTHYQGTFAGDWVVAHEYGSLPTSKCGAGRTLSWCLQTIATWHNANPGHPLLTVWLDKKQNWEGTGYTQRSPYRLDQLLYNYFGSALVRPGQISGSNLRAAVESAGWPSHSSLAGKVMFVITSSADTTGNARLRDYVAWHLWNANAFVAPYATVSSHVTTQPASFTSATTPWVAIYNFEWVDGNNDGECDGSPCFYVRTAHDRKYLARVWDVDDALESDLASSRPFGGTYGHANFIAIDYPWQQGGNGGYGNWPDGVYPW